MVLVDMHVHLGRSRDGASLRLEEIQRLLDQNDISHAVVFPIDEKNPGPSYRRMNSRVHDAVKGDRRLIGFCRLNPAEGDAAYRELERCAKLGFRGVKLHPRAEDFSPHEAEDLVAAIERMRLAVILHASHEHHCRPMAWQEIFLRHKKISFILAHAGKDAYLEAGEVAAACRNVYLETSTLSYRRTVVLLKKAGPRKMLFGSDAPYSHPAIELLKLELTLGKRAAMRRKIFSENPIRILGDLP